MISGQEAYKQQLANTSDRVHTLHVDRSKLASACTRLRIRTGATSKRVLTGVLERWKVDPQRARLKTKSMLRTDYLAHGLFRDTFAWLRSRRHDGIYCREPDRSLRRELPSGIQHNSIGDLLTYVPQPVGPTRQEFLADAQERLEHGQHAFTHVDRGRLALVVWLARTAGLKDSLCENFPADLESSAIGQLQLLRNRLDDEYGVAKSALKAMLQEASQMAGVKLVYLMFGEHRPDVIRAINDLGFADAGSQIESTTLGRRRRWTAGPAPAPPSPAHTASRVVADEDEAYVGGATIQ